MTKFDGGLGARHVRLADLPQAEIGDHIWHPVRRELGATGFGVGAYSAAKAGDVLVGTHDEEGSGSNHHEELYVVLRGRALFELDGRELDIGPEEFLLVAAETRRGARALVDGTSVLVIGGTPGAVTPAPYEHWYAALTADEPSGSAEIAAAGLVDHPRHGHLHYQLACFNALAGDLDAAARHLRQSVTSDERAWSWLVDDVDLDALRDVAGRVPTRRTIGPVSVEQAGAGLDVVLLHAGIADSRMWDPQWVAWPDARRITRLDLRGFGRSGRPVGSFSHAGDVVAVLDELSLERVVLVGASLGGRVALEVALARPGIVRGLVLAAPAVSGHSWSAEFEAFGEAEDEALAGGDVDRATDVNVDFWLPAAPDWVRAAVHEQQHNAFVFQLGAAEESLLEPDLASRLSEIDVPSLAVVGDADRADFQAITERLVRTLPDARRATIAGANHLPSLEQPSAFDSAVLPFLDSLE